MSNEHTDPRPVLREYDIGDLHEIAVAGGTAGRTWKVSTSSGDYFLRLRGVRTSGEDRLRFDHGLREHLVSCGVPTAAAIRTRGGDQWLHRDERVYELYPFVVGRLFRPEDTSEVAEAGRALAEYHRVAADYRPSIDGEDIAQYTTLGFFDTVSDRMDDPRLQRMNMLEVRKLAATEGDRRRVDWCLGRVEQAMTAYAGNAYERLTGWVIHGDYTPANLLFSDMGEVVGIFDLDWALPGARCRDVADGLYFFATEPREIDSASIWSLTDAADFAPDRCALFLRAYQEVAPLDAHEVEAIPSAFAGRWFSIRLEGMAKVPREERFRFFSRDVEKPLHWLDEHWADLRRAIG